MKRRFIKKDFTFNDSLVPIPLDNKDLVDYANHLSLLNDIPLTYLLSDVSDLPPESIRFGIIDQNWINAYIDGAFSIGRVCGEDGKCDKQLLTNYKYYVSTQLTYLNTPRMKKMHSNHSVKRSLLAKVKMNQDTPLENLSEISVVLIRSELVSSKKGLRFLGYLNDKKLNTLRIDKISDDIMICLFSGIIDRFVIEEPLTGLNFGCYKKKNQKGVEERIIDIRSIEDNENFGKKFFPPLSIDECIEPNGRIKALDLSSKIATFLNNNHSFDNQQSNDTQSSDDQSKITPSRFAFEMIAIPHRFAFARTQKSNKER